jgi:[ribosomal protein S18]-alanine N-acetyltransferase
MKLTIQPLTDAQIREFSGWQYDGPYALYNMTGENEAEQLAFFQNPANGYFAIVDEAGTLLGFCNFGADAQVPGGDYGDDAIDVGIGIRPDLTGQGRGAAYTQAVLAFAQAHYPGQALRVTIAAFNQRAQRVCEKHGFEVVDKFERAVDKRPFFIMIRRAA